LAFPALAPVPVLIQQGKLLDFIDGTTQRQETPEEYVRQEILKSLVREYHYPKADVAVEFAVPIGSKKTRADILIFAPSKPHTIENAFLVVECKSDKVKSTDRKEGVEQLRSYLTACPNAAYGMWTNGVERFCYRRLVEAGQVTFEEVPDVPAFGQKEDEAERPRFDQLKAATSDALMFAFKRCHNYIAANQGLQKPEAFWELLKLIFCKIQDERSDAINFYTTATERKSLNGQLVVKGRLDKIFNAVRADFPAIFQPKDGIDLLPPVLTYLVSQLQGYSLLQSDVDVKGHAYEEIVGSNLRGDRGEFFTPRNLCDMAVAMLDPAEGQLMLDPACGTGGFLIAGMNHVIEKIRKAELKKWNNNETQAEVHARDRIKKYAAACIVGLDFNPNLVKATKMNMVMNNDGAGGLYQANSLLNPLRWADDLRARDLPGRVDIVFSNPPFGSKLPIDDHTVLEQYDLGHAWQYDKAADRWVRTMNLQKSQPPEILFIERIVRLLKPGTGRAAIVLPDGILGAPGLGYVREWLLTHCRLLASVDMHPDTFQPNVSVQTSLLLVQRKTDTEIALEAASGQRADYPVFMAVANHIGHDKRGNRTYVRDERGNEVMEPVTELVRVADAQGHVQYLPQTSLKKVLDDNTRQIAQAFRQWLADHS
jgi:type I restriction enzyme M protein